MLRAKRPAPAARGKPLATLNPNVLSPAKHADASNKRRKIDQTSNVERIAKEAPRSSSRRRSGPYAAKIASATQDENAIDFSLLRGKQITSKAPNAPSVPATPSALLRSRFAPRRDSSASRLANFVPRQRPRSVLGIRTNDREDSLADDSLALGLLSSPPLSSPPRSIAAPEDASVVRNLSSKDLPSDLAHSDDESISLPSLARSPELEVEPVDESIVAPPASTSSSAPSPNPQPKSRNARGGQRKTRPLVKQLATNDLKAMLPKRLRRPVRQQIEHHDSLSVSEFSDADELSLPLPKQRKKPKPKAGSKANKSIKTNSSAGGKKRTYERHSLDAEESDEEGSEVESISSDSPPHARGRRATSKAATAAQASENAALKEEMKKMREKFAKVDEFELEFENFTGSSSSPMAR